MQRNAFRPVLSILTLCFAWVGLAQDSQDALHAPDGNSYTRIVSIFIAPIPNSAFTATVSTEWTRQTPDGATIVVKNYRLVAREGRGRVFEERRRFIPADSETQPALFQMDYVDPIKKTRTICHPQSNSCEINNFFLPPDTSALPVGLMPDGKRYLSRENLGKSAIEGLETIGTRETITIGPGTVGNDQQVVLTKEFWYSPKLGINLLVKRIDPTQGTQVFTVSNIRLAEPDGRLFAVPANYKTIDERVTPTPASAK
jgi:hypothetical protein